MCFQLSRNFSSGGGKKLYIYKDKFRKCYWIDDVISLKGDRIGHPKICHFGVRIILSQRYLKTAGTRRALGLLLCFLKAEEKAPMWKMPSYARKKETFFLPEMGSWGWENSVQTDLVTITHFPLVSTYILVTFPQSPPFVQHTISTLSA